MLCQETITQLFQNRITVRLYDSIDSTNSEAKRRADRDSGIHLYATQHQTAGRGRHGHDFYSPKGTGLYMTLSLPLSSSPAELQRITCAAAVAVCEAVEDLSGVHPQIKWVNDIYVDGKKAAGILTELITDDKNAPAAVIVGIGMNLVTKDFPAEFAADAGNLGDIEPNQLCARVADKLIDFFNNLNDNSIIEKYKQRNLCIGREVTFTLPDGKHTAKAVDIAPDGGLIVEENKKRLTLNAGEVSIKPI